jgi:secondary thiamine-phosphate synthase enzyme
LLEKIELRTTKVTEMIEITSSINKIVEGTGIGEGVCFVFIPHTTAAVTINENADPDVRRDIIHALNRKIPFDDGYLHGEGNSAAHIKSSLMGFSEMIIIHQGKLLLGTWQGVFFCEFDGPRNRSVYIRLSAQ